MSSGRSRIEEAKALRALKGVTASDAEFEKIRDTLFPVPDPKRDRALVGLSQEDEFAILCRLMGTCTHLARLDQTPFLKTEVIVPDYIASFAPGCSVKGLSAEEVKLTYSCFVEVKSHDKQKYRISERDLKRREEFPHHFGLPLVFAIRFTQYQGQAAWLLLTSKEFRRAERKVDLTQQIRSGIGHVLFDDYMIVAPNDFDVSYVWDSAGSLESIRHERYGALVEVGLFANRTLVPVDESERLLVGAVLESFRPRVVSTKTSGTKTTEILRVSANQGRMLSNLVYACNQLATDEATGKTVYDPVRITSSLDAEKPHLSLLERNHVEYIVEKHFLNRQLYKVGMGGPDEHLSKLRALAKHPLTT
jgi:hypothetical protein